MIHNVKKLVILGSTGSIGCQTLDIVRSFRDRFKVIALAAGDNTDQFRQQIAEFKPRYVTCKNNSVLKGRHHFFPLTEMCSLPEADMVIVATTGATGLHPALQALKAGKTTAIANKEILVMAGEIIIETAKRTGAAVVPIDSEHSAIWQCLRGEDAPVKRLLLTASGGPFFGKSPNSLARVTAKQALNHPTWKMGKKVTIDSATLFNKGMEAIEARWLFNIPYKKIEILIHRQSIVHSMVEFIDGSIKAQLSTPDMHLPIQYALSYPERLKSTSIASVDFSNIGALTFQPVDYSQFPCLSLALEAARRGGTYPAVLSASDEIAVKLFLEKKIKFTEIASIIDSVLNLHQPSQGAGLDEILSADAWAREAALKAAKKGK